MSGHLLDPLRNTAQPTVLFCGAGFSVGVVPDAAQLYEQVHGRVERDLGIAGTIDHTVFEAIPDPAGRLYAWAEAVIETLEKNQEPLPKLRFAEALGLLSDPRWWGRTEVDFRGTAPRHRVVARFAKEGIWHSVWSFNWDCILEHAFEQIGLTKGPPRFMSPWRKNHYVPHVHQGYFGLSKNDQAVNIHKPHGCVRALRVASSARDDGSTRAGDLSGRLMVGTKELADRSLNASTQSQDAVFFDALRDGIRGTFNLVVGWRMAEKSLRQEIAQSVGHPGTVIAVVDPEFSLHHEEVCQVAGMQSRADVHFELKRDTCPDRDDVFLWQQALFALEQLEATNANNPVLDVNGNNWRASVGCCVGNFFIDWADAFLPTWTRLCWSAGLLDAPAMPSHRIDLDHRDDYIPLTYRHVTRTDLLAAIALLNRLPELGDGFDAKSFPGGLFHRFSATLVVPLPSWGQPNDLRALRPMIDALRGHLGFVAKIAAWPIDVAPYKSGHEERERLLQRLSDIMPVPAFADLTAEPALIRLISDIKEVTDESH